MSYSAGAFHLLALLCTLIVEASGMALWARLAYHRPGRAVVCTILANLVVHTLFWYSQPFFTFAWPWSLYLEELLIVLLEASIYWRVLTLSGFSAWLLSFFLNLASFLAGLWLWQLLL
jgi:hypothetical protein